MPRLPDPVRALPRGRRRNRRLGAGVLLAVLSTASAFLAGAEREAAIAVSWTALAVALVHLGALV